MNESLKADVVVLGSGASGLVAAITAAERGASVMVIERSNKIGGTSAVSGGVVWVPNNPLQAQAKVADSRDAALSYLQSLSLGVMDMTMATAFVDRGPEMIAFLQEHTPLRFHLAEGYPDYHPEHPGGLKGGGRSLDPDLFPFASLGNWAARVNQSATDSQPNPPARPITLMETLGNMPTADVLAERAKHDYRGMGNALIGALLKGCLDRGIAIETESRATELIRQQTEHGQRVIGVRCTQQGHDISVFANKAVILATGGFEWNAELVRSFLRGPVIGAASPPENEGDGLIMAMEVGAALANMSEAWWMPTIPIPGETVRGRPLYRLCLAERTLPGSMLVNCHAQRFVNEAANYNDIGRAFHTFDPTRFGFMNSEAWLIFDDRFAKKYPIAGYGPREPKPDGLIRSAPTLEQLAQQLQLPGDQLVRSVQRFNEFATQGQDPDFGRGESAYDGFNGDRSFSGAMATLGPVETAPYHAIKIVAGALGTKGGPKTNPLAQVLDARGRVIPGLYAVGNAMAGSTGMVYGGAGGTLGPGMTFGYIAGISAASS